jgi:ectoine hydroxylase-related dioxygenase (phytanoyl-CoA dioxygenase family)
MNTTTLDSKTTDAYREDGVTVLRNVIPEQWREALAQAIAQNMSDPGPYGKNHDEEGGVFFGDYVNWKRFDAYRTVCSEGPLGEIASQLMNVNNVRLFHEHVLVKEPGTSAETPWHQDMPYYCIRGTQTVSIWVPLDPVAKSVCPQFLAGSHDGHATFMPRWFKTLKPLEGDTSSYRPFPEIDQERDGHRLRSWELSPGDAIAFDYHTVHNAPANQSDTRRRAVSLRMIGDDARYVERPHAVSPPFPDLGLKLNMGDELPEDWFPTVYTA